MAFLSCDKSYSLCIKAFRDWQYCCLGAFHHFNWEWMWQQWSTIFPCCHIPDFGNLLVSCHKPQSHMWERLCSPWGDTMHHLMRHYICQHFLFILPKHWKETTSGFYQHWDLSYVFPLWCKSIPDYIPPETTIPLISCTRVNFIGSCKQTEDWKCTKRHRCTWHFNFNPKQIESKWHIQI